MKSTMTPQPPSTQVRPWQRALALCLVVLLVCPPAVARGGGRAGMDALMEEPDMLAPTRANMPANILWSSEQTLQIPGSTVAGSAFGQNGQIDISVGKDSVAGSPAGMKLGKPQYSATGEMVVPLLGVASNARIKGVNAVPAVRAVLGRVDLLPKLHALKTVEVPPVPDLNAFIRDKKSAIELGKALFWESNAGSDGNACASCHFAGGADVPSEVPAEAAWRT